MRGASFGVFACVRCELASPLAVRMDSPDPLIARRVFRPAGFPAQFLGGHFGAVYKLQLSPVRDG